MTVALVHAHRDARKTVMLLAKKQFTLPAAVLASEISRTLSQLLYSYLNGDQSCCAHCGYLAELFYLCAGEPATAIGDRARRAVCFTDLEIVPEVIARGYDLWERLETPSTVTKETHRARPYDERRYADQRYAAVRELSALVDARDCLDFVIHGSLADMTDTAFSDLDTWMVVRRETIVNADKLRALRRRVQEIYLLLKRFDPLQHHGVFVAAEHDLGAYRRARFPPVLLETAASLCGAPVITFTPAEDGMERASAVYQMASRLKRLDALPDDPFRLKLVLSWVMLLPALHHQLTRGYCNKARALEVVRDDFSTKAWRSVEVATTCRAQWDRGCDPPDLADIHRFAQETLEQLDQQDLVDVAWDQIDLEQRTARPAVTEHPAYYTRQEFEQVARVEAERLGAAPVRAVYATGSVDTPTLGISDLDHVIVLESNPDTDPNGRDLLDQLFNQLERVPTMARYIKWHRETLVERSHWEQLEAYWRPTPRRVAGRAIRNVRTIDQEAERDHATLLLFEEGLFQLSHLASITSCEVLPLRTALLRISSIRYDVAIARDYFEVTATGAPVLIDEITALRSAWFDLSERTRVGRLCDLIFPAVTILKQTLSLVAEQLQETGIVDCSRLRSLGSVHQDLERLTIRYGAAPHYYASNDYLELPLAALPLVYQLYRDNRFAPDLPDSLMSACLHPRLRLAAGVVHDLKVKNQRWQEAGTRWVSVR